MAPAILVIHWFLMSCFLLLILLRCGTAPLQEVTWHLKQYYPGRILTAEITPEDPHLMQQYGFDAIWVHSGEGREGQRDWGCRCVTVLGLVEEPPVETTHSRCKQYRLCSVQLCQL